MRIICDLASPPKSVMAMDYVVRFHEDRGRYISDDVPEQVGHHLLSLPGYRKFVESAPPSSDSEGDDEKKKRK